MALLATAIIEEDWLYFKQHEDAKWLLKYCRCQSPFLFIYKNEDLKRAGKPECVLIINQDLQINKTSDRISYCSFVKIKKKFAKAEEYWSAVTYDGYIIIAKLYHVDVHGNKINRSNSKKKKKSRTSRTFSVGMTDDTNDTHLHTVISTKQHDEIKTIYKWDITQIKITHSGSPEVVVEQIDSKAKLAQLRFSSKEAAALFTKCVLECMDPENIMIQFYRERLSSVHPDITGTGKPLFPFTINDQPYDKNYYFLSLNQSGIDKWYKLLSPKPIDLLIKPLINRLEMDDSSLVNLDEVDEIYDLISRDLNIVSANANSDAMQRIINLPMEKRLLIIHMNAISNSFQGVHYWIAILEKAKDPKHVLTLFLKHLDKQAVKKAKFIEQFVGNDGLVSLLSIHKKLKQDIVMSDGEESFREIRILLAKVFDVIASAPPYNETIREDEATDEQKYQSIMRKPKITTVKSIGSTSGTHSASKKSTEKKIIISDNNEEVEDDFDQAEMKRLYGDDSDLDEKVDEVKKIETETHTDLDLKAIDINTADIKNTEQGVLKISFNKITSTNIFSKNQQTITHLASPKLAKAIQIRYKSGAEVLFESEQKEEVIEYLVTSIWGLHETEVLKDDLSPGIGVIKCLITLCLLKPEFAAFITTVLLDLTDLGKEIDNWWLPMIKTIQNALEMFKSSSTIFSGTGNMFIVQDQCRNYILGLLTLILTMIDGFDIEDRIIERRMLDSISFDDLLYDLANNIQNQQLHAIIELYRQSKAADINEIAYSQMEITQEFLDYLRDKTIENGFHEYFSNILTNLAAFPDDAEEAWINVEQYVYHWRTKFDTVDEESITPEIDIKRNKNVDIANSGADTGDGDGMVMNGFVPLSEVRLQDLDEKEKSFLTIDEVDKLDKTKALNSKIETLETEKNELNAQYQTQLTRNNEFQELLKEYQDKISVLQHKIKENENQQNVTNAAGGTGDAITEEEKKKLKELKRKEKEEAEIRVKKKKIKKYERKKDVVDDKKEEKKQESKPGELPPLSEADQKLVDKYKKQLKMRVPAPAVRHKIKYKEKAAHLLPYVFPEDAAKIITPAPKKEVLPELNDKDKAQLEKYKKLLKMNMPPGSVKLKMKRAKHHHLLPYIFEGTGGDAKKKQKKTDRPKDVDEKPKLKPNVAMLPFHWNKIKEKAMKKTVWYDIYHKFGKYKENKIFELIKLDELFGKPEEEKKSKKSKKEKKKKKSNTNAAPSEVIVLDKKTRQKVEIFLNRVRMNWNMSRGKICDHIMNMNESGLTHDHIEKLMTVAPNTKQAGDFRKSIKGLNKNDMLAKAALFWQELLTVDRFIKDRLTLWDFKLSFKGLLNEEQIKTDLLNECIMKIKNDDEFKMVLSLALDIGNYVNGGKRQGQAYGFNIATLEKLDQFPRRRNADGSAVPTMLEYIYILLRDKYPDSLSWTDNLQILNQAIGIDLSVINANLKKFEQNIDLLHDRIQTSDETQFSGKNFVHKMSPFYSESCKQLETFTDCVKTLNKELKKLGEWFGVEDGDGLEFLKQINAFRKTFKSIGQRLEKRKKDAERKAKREKKSQARRQGKGRGKKRKIQQTSAIPKQVDVTSVGGGRRGSILRAVSQLQPLNNLDPASTLVPQWSRGSGAGRSRVPSVSMAGGGLKMELSRFASYVDNKIKV